MLFKKTESELLELRSTIERLESENRSILAMQSISEVMLTRLDIGVVLQRVVDLLVQQLGYRSAAVFLYNRSLNKLDSAVVSSAPIVKKVQKFWGGPGLELELTDRNNYSVRAILEKKTYIGHNLYDFTRPKLSSAVANTIQKAYGIKTLATVPIQIFNNVLGVLALGMKSSEIGTTEQQALTLFANQVAIAIYNGQLFAKVQQQVTELKDQAKDLSALHDLSSLAGSSLKRTRVLQSLLDNVPQKLGHLGVIGAAVLLTGANDPQKIQAMALTQTKLTKPVLDAITSRQKSLSAIKTATNSSDVLQNIFEKKQAQYIQYLSDAFPHVISTRVDSAIKKIASIKSYALYPIQEGKNTAGLVLMSLAIPVEKITKRETEIFQVFVNHLASALENADLYERLSEQYKTVERQTKELALANQRLRTLDRSKSEFISIASHQLRTPLTVIRGYLSLLQEGSIGTCDQQALGQIGKIMKSTERLVSLIERGTMEFHMQPAHLEDLAKDVFDEFYIAAKDKNLKYTFVAPREPTPLIDMDQQKLRQTITNLIDNAIKYTSKGAVTVAIKRTKYEVRLSVIDTGIGLTQEARDNLFQKFVRGEGVAQLNTEGVGLGLYVAKQIVAHHNGTIWADSDGPGKGSTFSFALKIPSKQRK